MKKSDLAVNECHPNYRKFVNLVDDVELLNALEGSCIVLTTLIETLTESELTSRYKPSKWTIKEILVHLIDTERIFNYRALRYARQDKTPLHGFEQDDYVGPSNANERDIEDILSEYKAQRASTVLFFKNMTTDMLKQIGIAEGKEMSVRAIGFLQSGHELHHLNVIKDKYLKA